MLCFQPKPRTPILVSIPPHEARFAIAQEAVAPEDRLLFSERVESVCRKRASKMPAVATSSERRGIPAAPFVHDVQTFLTQSNFDAASALSALQDRLQQYKIAEMKLLAQRRDLQAKIPDIKKCVEIVGTLISKKGTAEVMKADFELAEGIYSRALIEEADSVCLWLGANVMLEYSCEEAMSLLQKNLENADGSLQAVIEDMQFLRDQVTVTEVTIARVYNWDVHQRRKLKNLAKDESSEAF